MKKTELLKVGDQVGIVAPGATFNREKFDKGIDRIKSMGLRPIFSPSLFSRDFLFAGTVEERASDFIKFARDPQIKAIWCVRAGAGAYAVAQLIAEKCGKHKIPKRSKMVIGMSDVTALHLLLTQTWKWPVIHGPLIERLSSELFQGLEEEVLSQTLFQKSYKLRISEGLTSIGKQSDVTGVLTGGNLSLLASSIGTKWELDSRNKILFIEELSEPAYRIDRMLCQLQSAGKFKNLKALVVGSFTECLDKDGKERWEEVFQRYFSKALFPVLLGVKSGHGDVRLALPFGFKVRVSNRDSKPRFEILESFGLKK